MRFESHLGQVFSLLRGLLALSVHILCCEGAPSGAFFIGGRCCGRRPPPLLGATVCRSLPVHGRSWIGQHDLGKIRCEFLYCIVGCSPGTSCSAFGGCSAYSWWVRGGRHDSCPISRGSVPPGSHDRSDTGYRAGRGANVVLHVAHDAQRLSSLARRFFRRHLFMVTCGDYYMALWIFYRVVAEVRYLLPGCSFVSVHCQPVGWLRWPSGRLEFEGDPARGSYAAGFPCRPLKPRSCPDVFLGGRCGPTWQLQSTRLNHQASTPGRAAQPAALRLRPQRGSNGILRGRVSTQGTVRRVVWRQLPAQHLIQSEAELERRSSRRRATSSDTVDLTYVRQPHRVCIIRIRNTAHGGWNAPMRSANQSGGGSVRPYQVA